MSTLLDTISAQISTNHFAHAYDYIGNVQTSTFNAATNTYTANCLNQYTSILRNSETPHEPTLKSAWHIHVAIKSDPVEPHAEGGWEVFSHKEHKGHIGEIGLAV